MIDHVLAAVAPLAPARTIVVVAPGMEQVAAAVAPRATVVQAQQRGTGHAVAWRRAPALEGFAGDVLVLYGDTPLVTTATLRRSSPSGAARPRRPWSLLGMRPPIPAPMAGW